MNYKDSKTYYEGSLTEEDVLCYLLDCGFTEGEAKIIIERDYNIIENIIEEVLNNMINEWGDEISEYLRDYSAGFHGENEDIQKFAEIIIKAIDK